MVLWEGACRAVGGQNVPGDPPPCTHRAADTMSRASQTWLHPRITKIHTHRHPHTGRAQALSIRPRNALRAQNQSQLPFPAPHTPGPLLLKAAGDNPHLRQGKERKGRKCEVKSLQFLAEGCESPNVCPALFQVPGTLQGPPHPRWSLSSLTPKPTSFLPHHAPSMKTGSRLCFLT